MRQPPRRGTIYLVTVATAVIVAALATAAMLAVRIQRAQVGDVADAVRARMYARAALDAALFRIENDADWRQKMHAGAWEAEQAIDAGTYSFRALDPVDGDLTNSVYDPVEITATGRCGHARQKLHARLKIRQPGLACLEPAVHAGSNLIFDAVTARADRFVSANAVVEARNSAQVYPDAEAQASVQAVSGGVFHGSTTTDGDWPREMPNVATVFDYYLANGTPIAIEDLPRDVVQVLANPGMEGGTASWYAVSCAIAADAEAHSGTKSIYVSARDSTSDTVAQDVTAQLQSGENYHAEAWLQFPGGDVARLMLKVVSSGEGTRRIALSDWTDVAATWTKVEGDATVSWTGALTQAEWYVETAQQKTYKIDDAALTRRGNVRMIHGKVLSPASNPFGSGVTNPQGIYVIDCGGQRLSISDSRIVGTLVLLNQHEESWIGGSINWEPAVRSAEPSVTNLPALLTNAQIAVKFVAAELSEAVVGANFNPAGTPYNGTADADQVDVYPSVIKGIVYSSGAIVLSNHPTFEGVVVGQTNVEVNGADLDVTYDPVYYKENAPPGFRAGLKAAIVPGSVKQVVD